MIVEIVSTGTELLLGEILDSNAQFLSTRLNELGFSVLYRSTVGDNHERMAAVLKTALQRADIVITTGGLGPTQGDITKEVTAKLFDLPMRLDSGSLERINQFFAKRDICMPQSNKKQAEFAEGADIIVNNFGTAPGMSIKQQGKMIINLPGPPVELKGIFEEQVVPYLDKNFGYQGIIYSKTLKMFGIGESSVANSLEKIISNQDNPTVAIYARDSDVLVRLTAQAKDKQHAQNLLEQTEQQVRACLGEAIYGINEDDLQTVVGQELLQQKQTIGLAESCTGGLVTAMLTEISGCSNFLKGSIVCYSNESKVRELQVEPASLQQYGAVSEQVAKQMACGVRNLMQTDLGVGITGIAGPDGGSELKPVGLVYIAVATASKVECQRYLFTGTRNIIRYRVAKTTLMNVLKIIKNKKI